MAPSAKSSLLIAIAVSTLLAVTSEARLKIVSPPSLAQQFNSKF